MTNWKSTTSEYTPIQSTKVIAIARMAREMHKQGIPVKEIAYTLQRSTSRIYEYLRNPNIAPKLSNK